MCGRYALSATPTELIETFSLARCVDFQPRFNVAPMSLMPVIRQSPDGDRVADLLRWGLIPNWAKDPSIGAKLNNARGESVAEKPSFRDAFKRRRCLIPASGFYEWKTEGQVKQPYFISNNSGEALALAGLWESWRDEHGEMVRTYYLMRSATTHLAILPLG
jgi:putative SOS response-associated peptidase YedK